MKEKMQRREFIIQIPKKGLITYVGLLFTPAFANAANWQKVGGSTPRAEGIRLPIQSRRRTYATVTSYSALRSDGVLISATSFTGGAQSTFVAYTSVASVVSVASGGNTVIKSDGSIWARGDNSLGRLGTNNTTSTSTFIQATGISNAVAIGGFFNANIALRSDGRIFGSGGNNYGQLGINNVASRLTYVQATGISNAVSIATGGLGHVLALRSDGQVFACGYGSAGVLGAGISGNKSTYVQVTGVSNAIGIACGNRHSLALRADGLVFSTGTNFAGQLGDSTAGSRETFAQVPGLSNVVSIAAGGNASFAILADGRVFGCGENANGELGFGNTNSYSSFVQVSGLSNIVSIASSGVNTFALRSDGRLFATGYNGFGELGIGNTTNQSSFVQTIGEY